MAESVLSDGRSAMKSMIWVSSFSRKQCWFCSEPLTHDVKLIVFVHEKHVFNF